MRNHADPNHRWDDCPDCGEMKIATAARCQACHMTVYLPRWRQLKARWRDLLRDWVDGAELRIGVPEGMEARDFVAIVLDVVNST